MQADTVNDEHGFCSWVCSMDSWFSEFTTDLFKEVLQEEGIFTEYKWVVSDYQVTSKPLGKSLSNPTHAHMVLSEMKFSQATE